MKHFLKSLLGLLVCISVLFSMLAINTYAAGTTIAFSKKSLTVGESVTVTVRFNAEEAIYGVSAVVNYDNNVLNYASGNAVGGAGSVRLVESPSGETAVSYALTFTAVASGNCTVSVIDANCSVQGDNGAYDKGLTGASATLTVTNAALSSNANLKSITVSNGRLSPAFSQSRTSYTVSVNNTVTEFNISAVAADSGSTVQVSGDKNLKLGNNKFTITVTAPSGNTKTYTITVKRSETNDVSDDTTSSETTENALDTNIGGTTYTVATDISSVPLFKGFTASTTHFKGQEIPVSVTSDGEYKFYYLKAPDSDIPVPYMLNEETGEFVKVNYFTQGDNSYIFSEIPEGKTVGEEFYLTSATINGSEVSCFTNNSDVTTDFYYLYCYFDGRYGFYRYDSRENVIQRYPEMTLTDIYEPVDEPENDNIFTRFSMLTSNAKMIVVMLLLVLVFAIVLVILLLVKLFNRKEYDQIDEELNLLENENFDNIAFNSFSIDDENDTEDKILEESESTDE